MSDKKSIVGTAVLSAALVLGVGAPLAYFALPKVVEKIGHAQSEIPSVVMDLKVETIREIQTSATKTQAEIKTQLAESEKRQAAALAELRQVIEGVKTQQDKIAASLEAEGLRDMAAIPGKRHDTFNQTIHFPLGKVKGATITSQIAVVIANINERETNRNCHANVLGFSDTLGGDMANLKLSQERAAFVASELKAAGVKIGEIKGWGERWLDVHTPDATKNDKNRRVVIELDCARGPKQPMPST